MPPIALSLSEEVEKFGAYAGLVAFFGFAALVILHFAQAREIKRLREWAGRAPERAAELEARVAADAARRAAVPARQPPPSAPPAPATAAGAPAPGAPAAATAAPAAEAAPGNGPPAASGTDGEEGAGPEPAAEAGAQPEEQAAGAPAADRPTGGETPAGGAGNGTAGPPPVPRATPQPSAPGPAGPPPRRPAPAAGLRQSAPPTRRPGQPPPRRPGAPADAEPRSRARMAIIAGSSLVAVVFAALAAVQLLGGGEDRPAPNVPAPVESTATPAAGDDETAPAPSRADTTVAVLNGTTVTGLAAQIADDIEQAGFIRGATANYSDQARSASLVFYEGEFRRRAQEVARIVDLPAEDVEPITDDVRSLAGDADVVVVVGADQAP